MDTFITKEKHSVLPQMLTVSTCLLVFAYVLTNT